MKNLPSLFLATLGGLLLIIICLWINPVPNQATGVQHEKFQTMLSSGETVMSFPTSQWLAYFFGIFIISIFSLSVFMGAKKKDPSLNKKIQKQIGIGLFLYLLVFSFMVFSWWSYTQTNSMEYFMGIPKPTAWMIFGLLFIPLFFSIIYIRRFHDWIITDEELNTFNEIVKRRNSEN